jgi:N-acetylmuramoyl-L-alanine amidase
MKLVWNVSLLLRYRLEKRGMKVVLTKASEKQYVKNLDRSAIANRARADLFLRLHADAVPERGFASYYPSQQGRAQGKTGPSRRVIEQSRAAAQAFHPAVIRALGGKLNDRGLRTDLQTAVGAKQGALTGSIFSQVPVVLVEMATLTEPEDEKVVKTKEGQEMVARALEAGVDAALSALKKVRQKKADE